MISVDEALESVIAGISPLAHEDIYVADGLGRVLAEDGIAQLTYPPSAVSSMDGYAVTASDASKTLTQIGVSQAGNGFDGTLKQGETVRIFTGAPLPQGANAVIMQENALCEGGNITINEPVGPGNFVRPAGMDFSEGDLMVAAGTCLSARDLGLLAASNVATLSVYAKPRIGYLATGDELVMPGENVGPDQIISSNSIALSGYIKALGGIPVSLGIARDNESSLRESFSKLDDLDMLITIGGASVGDYDLVRTVLGDEGMSMNFYKVAMRPGKPLIFGTIKGIPMLGLPGNPVSAGVTSLLFLKPAIERMCGRENPTHDIERGVLGCDLKGNDHRQDYLRSALAIDDAGNVVVTPYGKQDSAMMRNFTKANCLAIRSPRAEPAKSGDPVDFIRLKTGVEYF